jgi:hypothetical protein
MQRNPKTEKKGKQIKRKMFWMRICKIFLYAVKENVFQIIKKL